MNWLITGGCGFLGTSLIKHLGQERGHNIRVLDNLSVGKRDDLRAVVKFTETSSDKLSPMQDVDDFSCELVVGDILDEYLALEVCKGADVIVHFAANTGVPISVAHPREDCMANVLGTFNYLEGARQNRVNRFIFASSGAPAGEVEPPIHEELPAHPVSPYGASKLAGEGYCSAYYKTFGVKTVSLRFGNVYGPGSKHKSSVVAKFIRQAFNGETCEIFGDGNQTRDFIYIDDLIDAVVRASHFNGGGEVFQIATNQETTLNELMDVMQDVFEKNGIAPFEIVNSEERLGDVKRNYSDISKAKEVLGWNARVELSQGLNKTLKYFLDND